VHVYTAPRQPGNNCGVNVLVAIAYAACNARIGRRFVGLLDSHSGTTNAMPSSFGTPSAMAGVRKWMVALVTSGLAQSDDPPS